MKRLATEALIKVLQKLEPDLRVYKNEYGDVALQAENKVNWYRAMCEKKKERIRIKKEKIIVINDMLEQGHYQHNLERLDLRERKFLEEEQIADIEMDIAAKDFYSSKFVFRIKDSEKTQKEISEEAGKLMKEYVAMAEMTLNDSNLSQKSRAIFHGILAVIHKGFTTEQARNSAYGDLRDALLDAGAEI